MVVKEECGTPAGLCQALRETRRERGRAAPWERETHVLGSPKTSTIYRGRGGDAPPPRVPSLGVAAAPRSHLGGGQGGERGAHLGWALGPICPRVCPLSLLEAPWALVGGRTSPPGAGPLPHLAHAAFRGWVAPPGGPPGPLRWSRYNTDNPETCPDARNRTSHI